MEQKQLIVLELSKADLEHLIENAVEKALANLQAKKPEDRIVTRKDIAELFKVSLTTVNSWSRTGKLKRRYMGSRVYFLYTEVEEMLKRK